jgi:hypothetical protein
VARPAISLIEAGQANSTIRTLQQLADALRRPLADPLKGGRGFPSSINRAKNSHIGAFD